MVRSVGPPGGLETVTVPSKIPSRRARPRSPLPRDGSAPPCPSSLTTMRSALVGQVDTDGGLRRAGVPGRVGERLGDREVGGRLDRLRQPPGRCTVTTSTVDCPAPAPARRRRARARPAPAGGCRAPARAAPEARWPPTPGSWPAVCRAAAGSVSSSRSIAPRLMPTATSRACAPSCRSRSMRRSSPAEAVLASARVWVSCSTRCARTACGARREQHPGPPAVPAQRCGGHLDGEPRQQEADRDRGPRVAGDRAVPVVARRPEQSLGDPRQRQAPDPVAEHDDRNPREQTSHEGIDAAPQHLAPRGGIADEPACALRRHRPSLGAVEVRPDLEQAFGVGHQNRQRAIGGRDRLPRPAGQDASPVGQPAQVAQRHGHEEEQAEPEPADQTRDGGGEDRYSQNACQEKDCEPQHGQQSRCRPLRAPGDPWAGNRPHRNEAGVRRAAAG